MENGPKSFQPGAMERLEHNIGHLEGYLLRGRQKKAPKERLISAILRDVGEETIDHKTRLLAVGYSENADGFVLPDPITVETDEARLRGVVIRQLGGEERALLQYDVYDVTDNEHADLYLVTPLAILESAVDEERLHPLFEVIEQTKFLAERMFRDDNFFQQSAQHQAELLTQKVSSEFMGYAAADYHEEVLLKIACDWYYQLPASADVSDDWSQYIRAGATLEGYITNATYPECLLSPLKQISQRSDFTDGYGLPYIVLENKSIEGLTLIPLTAAVAFSSDIDSYV
jgi:hypothetical protein